MSDYLFEDYIKSLSPTKDTFRTFGMVFEVGLDEEARKNLIENPMTEKRNGIRGVSEEVLENENTFYVVGAFLKLLQELGFSVEETVEEESDFCGSITLNDNLTISVEFSYGKGIIEYKVQYMDDREVQGEDNFLKALFDGGWGLPNFNNTLDPHNLFEDLETFMRDFRRSWDKYQKILKTKVDL
jgi:hypothetical protein